jgi:hypothetical protein
LFFVFCEWWDRSIDLLHPSGRRVKNIQQVNSHISDANDGGKRNRSKPDLDSAAPFSSAYLDKICTEDDTKWNELVAPAPMGIAVLSQLMICTSQLTDFKIDNIDREKINLIKKPDSFRTTLVQIVNDAYNAFMKAHTNMEKIKLQVAQVPDYVKDCVKIIKSDNKVAIDKFANRQTANRFASFFEFQHVSSTEQTVNKKKCKYLIKNITFMSYIPFSMTREQRNISWW